MNHVRLFFLRSSDHLDQMELLGAS
uniref:Uncharacterized protein n=1 Tax=Anguilla anguilla TaxID=7936 RepID=A0A0E9RYL7_ANGAN